MFLRTIADWLNNKNKLQSVRLLPLEQIVESTALLIGGLGFNSFLKIIASIWFCSKDLTKLLVVGGQVSLTTDSTDCEIVNLSETDVACVKPPDYPFKDEGGFTYLNGDNKPVVCGGLRENDGETSDCWGYDASAAEWQPRPQMMEPRAWPAAVPLGVDEVAGKIGEGEKKRH